VIEVGAIRFVNGLPIAEFTRLINPQKPIPTEISDLTGIRDADVADACSFESIADELSAFIGSDPLCGHQIDFDAGFLNAELLRASRKTFKPPQLDTALLSRIVKPDLMGYSLSNVSDALGVPLASAHRALDDARASGFVALKLLDELVNLPFSVRKSMAHMCPASFLKSILFASLSRQGKSHQQENVYIPGIYQKLLHPDDPIAIEPVAVADFFKENGAL
jgi:DNA polymerase III epsilon subunit family exonuclease